MFSSSLGLFILRAGGRTEHPVKIKVEKVALTLRRQEDPHMVLIKRSSSWCRCDTEAGGDAPPTFSSSST